MHVCAHEPSHWLEDQMSYTMQRVLVRLAATGEHHATKVLPCGSKVADLLKELEGDQRHMHLLLSNDRVLTAEEPLPSGEEISLQLLRQDLLGRWTRRTGSEPVNRWDPHDYKKEILLLRKDGQGRFCTEHSWCTRPFNSGRDREMVGCLPHTLQDDPEGLGRFLENSEEAGASWEVQVLGDPAEPFLCIAGAGWIGGTASGGMLIERDFPCPNSFVVPLQQLQKNWEFSPT